ncbi:DUF6215 domain-containing protein [Streptomyces sp. NBC_00096]|uniref:DUF6215 domain-containing protein n=1 Tax=Streptomyces sp. NBC_00096 TaxID=2975650 RepID=UPI0032435843
MADDIGARPGGAGAWGQAFTALVLVGSLGVGLWAVGQAESAERARKPAACSGGGPEEPVRSDGETARHVSGAELCAALNRPDLADLLGTGEELATIAYGRGGSRRDADGQEIATPTARVEIGGYTVALSATYSHLPLATYAGLLTNGTGPRTVLGRPAYLYSDRTLDVSLRVGGVTTETRPGVPVRAVILARDAQDSGGSFDVSLWRKDGAVPDDAVLLRVAEQVLPTVPGWTTAG